MTVHISCLFFLAMMILGSWDIGQVAELTRSVLASACFHLVVQVMMFNSLITNGINGTEKLVVLIVSVAVWVLIMRAWKMTGAPVSAVSQ